MASSTTKTATLKARQLKFRAKFALAMIASFYAPALMSRHFSRGYLLAADRSLSSQQADIFSPEKDRYLIDQSCRQLKESTSAFAKAVHDNAEQVSFPTWTVGDQWSIPKLDRKLLDSAFAGKRVAMAGDSTLFYTLNTLNRVVNSTGEKLLEHISTSMNLTYGLKAINEETNRLQAGRQVGQIHYPHGGHIVWKGFRGSNIKDNCRFDDLVWPSLRQQRPEIIVANWGLHLFHRAATPQRLCIVDQFVHYEEWLQTILSIAQQVGTRLVLFKTTNYVCHEKLPDPARDRLERMQHENSTFVEGCVTQLQQWRSKNHHFSHLTDPQFQRYCKEGAMTDENAQKLNHRMAAFVEDAKQRGLPPNLTVEVFNDHDMEMCSYTSKWDGLHYHALQVPRIRMMAHMIQCLYSRHKHVENYGELAAD